MKNVTEPTKNNAKPVEKAAPAKKAAPAEKTASAKKAASVKKAAPVEKAAPAKKTSKKFKSAINPALKIFGKIRNAAIITVLLLTMGACSVLIFPSFGKDTSVVSAQRVFVSDLASSVNKFETDSLGAVFEMPQIHVLPWSEDPVPAPNQNNFGSETLEDGTEVLTYKDESLSVRYWTERNYESNCYFADIEVAHPTQLRTGFAGGEFNGSQRLTPETIAQQINAVVAINADYCGYRNDGIIIRQHTVYRTAPFGWDSLLIDTEGDFHLMRDFEVENTNFLEQYDIVNSFVFGPTLIIDGKIELRSLVSGCGPEYNVSKLTSRTGIGQLGRLHYLFCVVDGGKDYSPGITTTQLAQIMFDKGCYQAYNLDGGRSSSIIFNGKDMNESTWGGHRNVTDIVYVATAVPNE